MPNLLHPNIQIPAQGEVGEALQEQLNALWRQYKVTREKTQPAFQAENVRFDHNPDWRGHAFSIQSAADCVHPIWKATRITVAISECIWVVGPFVAMIR